MTKFCTSQQFGNACEHYIISRLGFANVPAQKMPDGWPGYDVVAQPRSGGRPLRISVKGRRSPWVHKVWRLNLDGTWDWLALILAENGTTRCWIMPHAAAKKLARSRATGRIKWAISLPRLESLGAKCS
jgi:hypothetical protein